MIVRAGTPEAAMVEHVPALEWIKFEVLHVADELKIYMNEVLVAAKPAPISWSKAAPLIAGDRENGYRGIIDELVVGLIVPRDTYTLPPQLLFELGGGARPNAIGQLIVCYDREGRLDRARHTQPIQLKIFSPESEESGFQVELNGTVPR